MNNRDKPRHRPTVPEVLPLANAYYCFDGCGAGGSLHIVLDDDNIEDGSIDYCIECARDPTFWLSRDHWNGHDEAGELLGRLLRLMTLTQRAKVCSACSGGYGKDDMIECSEFLRRARELLGKYEPQTVSQ